MRFGKEWLNPVPRASAIALISGDAGVAADAQQAGDRGLRRFGGGRQEHDHGAARYSQLLDVLGIMSWGVMSRAMTVDQALAEGHPRGGRDGDWLTAFGGRAWDSRMRESQLYIDLTGYNSRRQSNEN